MVCKCQRKMVVEMKKTVTMDVKVKIMTVQGE